MKFKVGDIAIVTKCRSGHWFPIGETIKLLENGHCPEWKATTINGKKYRNSEIWYVGEEEIEPAHNQSIHIYRHDNEVIATLKTGKQTTKTAKAKCNPADEFKFEIGAKLAFQRLIGEDENTVREVKRPAKVGEWIKATSNGTWHGNKYSVGDTYLVDDNYYTGNAYYHITKSDEIMLSIDNYVVLENYHPDDKPKTLADYTIKELVTELSRRYE